MAPPVTWTVTGSGAGTVWSATIAFSGFEILQADTSNLDQVTGPAGTVNWAITGPNALTLAGTALSGFDALVGGGGANTLTGLSAGSDWTLTGTGAGTVAGMAFSAFANLVGGPATAIDRVTGPNAITTWTIGSSAVTVLGLTLTAFDTLVGGTAKDTLFGPSATTAWKLNATNGGQLGVYSFLGFEELHGNNPGHDATPASGGSLDTSAHTGNVLGMALVGFSALTVQSSPTFTVSGTGGADTIIISAGSTAGTMQASVNGTITVFSDPTTTLTIQGLDGNDTITIASLDAAFAASLQIYGAGALTAAGSTNFNAWVHQFAGLRGGTDSVSITGSISTHGGSIFSISSSFSISAGTSSTRSSSTPPPRARPATSPCGRATSGSSWRTSCPCSSRTVMRRSPSATTYRCSRRTSPCAPTSMTASRPPRRSTSPTRPHRPASG